MSSHKKKTPTKATPQNGHHETQGEKKGDDHTHYSVKEILKDKSQIMFLVLAVLSIGIIVPFLKGYHKFMDYFE